MWVARSAVLLVALGVTPLLASPDLFNQAETCEPSVSTVTIEPSVRTVTVTVGETSVSASASSSVTTTATASTSSVPTGNPGNSTPGRSSRSKTGSAASETPKVSPGTSYVTSSDIPSHTLSSGVPSSGAFSESSSTAPSSLISSANPSSGTGYQSHHPDVIIGSLTVPIQSTPTTISQSGQPPIVVGPSGIQIGSHTLKSATTMTAEGVTVTYDGPQESNPPESASKSGGSTSTTAQEETATTSGAATTTTTSSSMASAWEGYVTINDETYRIPSDGSSLDIVLDDGSLLTLSSGHVSINGDKVDLPDDLSRSPTLTADGQSFTVGEGFDSGSGDGGSGGSGSGSGSSISSLIDTISGLDNAESSISSGLDKITSGIKSWASGGAESEVTSLSGSIDSAVESLDQLLGPMRSISQSPSIELQELTTDGLRVVSRAYPELERGRDILSSMRKLLKGLPILRDAATQNVKKYWLRYVATGGGLLALDQTIQKLKEYSWDDALIVTTTSTTAGETKTPSGTSTASTASPTASFSYLITTKRGTSLTTFKTFVHGLDGGAGYQMAYSEVDHQAYVTDLTATQVGTIKALPFIRTVSYNIPVTELDDDEDFRAVPSRDFLPEVDQLHNLTNHKSTKWLSSRAIAQSPRDQSGSHLKLISSDNMGKPTEDYLFDDTLGKGTTIYVIDTGFDTSKPDLASTDRKVETYVVPNDLTLMGVPKNQRKPEDLTDWGRHGTSVASVAGGVIRGVASRADLYLVKYKSAYDKPDANGNVKEERKNAPLAAMEDAFINVIRHIRQNSNQGKAVVNMSWGSKVSVQDFAARKKSLEDFISELEQLDVVVVIAAGNSNKEKLEERIPQNMGTDSNSIITVGGVNEAGQIWEHSTSQGSGGGSLTVFAQSENLEMDVPFIGMRKVHGTSYSAPAVAGLAAYYLGIPDTKKLFTSGSVSTMVKSYIKKTAFQRVQSISNSKTPAGYNFPSELKVAYNLARGNPPNCGSGKILPRGESDNACPAPSSSRESSSSSSYKSISPTSSRPSASTYSPTATPVTSTPVTSMTAISTTNGTTTNTGTGTTSTGIPSSTGKLTCKGGDGPTISLESLNNHTEHHVQTEGGIAHWCDNFLSQLDAQIPDSYDEVWDTAAMTVTLDNCTDTLKVPYNDCLDWWGEIANGCDTDSGDKHGGTYEIGCMLFKMEIGHDS
ncbi:subtilisin-like protein [Penicillium cf. griseofulvum]|uniref:Subtilisin-like protein n=1 Tax=Penicillium cf. griseofulvum TaxID=2972120 RepID=A0A9W9N1M9_9EURO|nr:subtilisin-like protein [Penicillium cf. griseofulvum]